MRFLLPAFALALLACDSARQVGPHNPPNGGRDAGRDGGAEREDAAPGSDAPAPIDSSLPDSAPSADAISADAAPEADASPADGGLVPASCPIGPADGCCPLLRYGGSDPDCPSLACDHLVPSAPIVLSDSGRQSYFSAAPMAWTGTELAIARLVTSTVVNGHDVFFERRAYDGSLTFGPTHQVEPVVSSAQTGRAALVYDASTARLVFAHSGPSAVRLLGLDLDGHPLWVEPQSLGICNGIDSSFGLFARGGRLFVSGDQYTCAGSTGQPALRELDAQGNLGPPQLFGDGMRPTSSWEAVAGCDLGCQSLLLIWDRSYEGSLRGRIYDTTASAIGPGFDLTSVQSTYIDHQGLASDGTRDFIYFATQTDGSGSTSRTFRLYQRGMGWASPGVTIGGDRGLQPSVIWTGAGFMVAVAGYRQTTSLAFPSDRREYHVHLFHFAPDGTLRESFDNETDAGLLPELAWAGGRIALTWIRVSPTALETHVLRYFDCP